MILGVKNKKPRLGIQTWLNFHSSTLSSASFN